MNNDTWASLYQVVCSRRANPQEGSYTCYLFDKGLDKILKKVGEECAETIIAAKNGRQEETVGEISDLIYNLMVMMAQQNIPLEAVLRITGSYRVYDRGTFRGDIGLHFHDRTRVIPSG